MKLTVVFDDKVIIKDANIYYVDAEDWTLTQTNIHAVQWDETTGSIEFRNGTANQILTAESEVSTYSAFYDSLTATYAARTASFNSIDQRFYDIGDLNRSTNTYPTTAKTLSTIQTEQVAAIKREANRLLSSSDWYVTRYYELGPTDPDGAIPSAVTTYRQSVRTASHTACQAILAAADFNAVTSVATPTWPSPLNSDTYYLAEY